MNGRTPHILLILLLTAGMIAPAVRAGCSCCENDPQTVAVDSCDGGCCSSSQQPADQPAEEEDDEAPCDCAFCGCGLAHPVIHRSRPVALNLPATPRLEPGPLACDPRDALDDLLRPPQA